MKRVLLLLAVCVLPCLLAAMPVQAANTDPSTGILVVTPDRGFLGNEEIRDAFDAFAADRNAEILYVDGKRSEKILDQSLDALAHRGAKRIAVLPLVVSAADARWQLARGWLEARRANGTPLAIAPVYGSSYLAAEDLAARLRALHTDKSRLLLVGYGATTTEDARVMGRDMARIAGFASKLDAKAIGTAVFPAGGASDAKTLRKVANDALHDAHGALVLPLAFAPRDDSMMDFAGWYTEDLPKDAQAVASPIAGTDALAEWMAHATAQAALQLQPADASDVGVIVLAHGADWFWNHDLMQSLAPVAAKHKLAWAFSMADPVVVERAVRKLEKQDVRAIVIVRVFGMADSFHSTVERMIGADVEGAGAAAAHGMAHHGMDMGMDMSMDMDMGGDGMGMSRASLAAAPRIRSALPIVTVGGVDDNPLFAKALLQQARALSKHSGNETIILVAHGQGEDAANQRWLDLLDSLARQMRADGGSDFRAIRVATWREDWPDKNKAAVAQVRAMVEAADRDGGRALVLPARTNGQGAADRYLKGLDFGWGQGFAQSPLFAEWVEQQVQRGVDELGRTDGTQQPMHMHHAH
jgi:hypothetical protein